MTTGITRRDLLAGASATALTTVAAGAAALPRSKIESWDITTDVLVVGSGAAGVSAAMSGGVVYAGGGTRLQQALGVEDSVEDMYNFLTAMAGGNAELKKFQLYCEQSAAHFDWLVAQGVPYLEKYTQAKGLPMGDESLYFSGNEQAWPARDEARPAPRGHVPGIPGMNGGRRMMELLLARAREMGVTLRSKTAAQRLVVESDGTIAGALVTVDGVRKTIRSRRGIVLACGGFIHNREMLQRYAPALFDCSVPWGNAGDLGTGINMGIAVGAQALRMDQGFAIAPLYPPENVLAGIVVNSFGQRFIAEDSYHGVLGDAIAYHQQGKAWLITDKDSSFTSRQDNFPPVAKGSSIGELAHQMQLPLGTLQNTVAYYNRNAVNHRDPMFRKNTQYVRPIKGPPYQAWDLSVDRAFFPAHTFGGLHTDVDGQVINSFGESVPGLFGAGRTTAGLPMAPYSASGLSVGDCTFFGRRAGLQVARQRARK